jgi:hypothetical protein
MADLSDVLNAFVTLINDVLYTGESVDANGNNLPSLAGPVVKLMRGTPVANLLDADLRAGVVNITVNERAGMGRMTTRFPAEWSLVSLTTATLTVAVVGNTLTIGGTATVGQGVMLIVDGQPYAVQAGVNDTPTTLAAALAVLVQVDESAVASSTTLNIPSATNLTARVVLQGSAIYPTRQQEAGIVIKVFAPSFALRDEVASFVDNALSKTVRLSLPDTSVAMVRYSGTAYDDQPQKTLTFIRTLIYQVEYSTAQTATETTIGVFDVVLSPGPPGGPVGRVLLVTDVGPAISPLSSDLAVELQDNAVLVDQYGNPQVNL